MILVLVVLFCKDLCRSLVLYRATSSILFWFLEKLSDLGYLVPSGELVPMECKWVEENMLILTFRLVLSCCKIRILSFCSSVSARVPYFLH